MMDALKDMKWPQTAVIISALASVVLLYKMGAGLTEISTFISALAVAYGAIKLKVVDRVEANTNGVNEGLRAEVARTKDQMAAMARQHAQELAQVAAQMPAGASLPKTLTEDPPPPVNGS